MAKREGQKLKLLYLRDYLVENTDEKHMASVQDMIDFLASKDIRAERKSIYDGEWSDRRTKWLLQSYDIRLVRD